MTSAMMSTASQPPLNRWMYPSSPIASITRFGTVWPAAKFTFDVSAPSARSFVDCTETWPAPVALVTVTLRATAVAPAGTFAAPATFSATELRGPTWAFAAPVPVRVSSSRVGSCAVNSAPRVVNFSSFTASVPSAAFFAVTLTSYVPSTAYLCLRSRASDAPPAGRE
ncbi:hypothetical protein ACFYNW_12270 [Streptomyces virginiae]|uniref:hypothetical protein n=1 Tax=Streptomyces virginiae TaxID=1961 RepID=UPI0036E13D86